MGGCGSLSGRWLHGAEHGAPRPETDVKGHRAKANKSCDNERFIEIGPKLLADRHTDRGLLPRHGVRYIAMNDGIDTMRDNNDIAPFKNILNEMYSKDISKKVHSSYLLKAQQGQFTGCVAPFGYRKDPEDKTTCWWTRKPPPLSGKSSFGRWKDTAPTLSGAGWKNRRCLALHGGTGNGASAMSAPNGKRKTRKTGGICGTSP